MRALLASALALIVSGCTVLLPQSAQFAIVNNGTSDYGGQISRDVVFDPDTGLALDIYGAVGADGPAPVVLFLYGGGWTSGARADYAFVGATLAEAGYTVVIPDYRKYPDVRFPAFVEDAASAIAWAHHKIAAHGGDPARITVMGHSAGAHSAALVAADRRYLAAHDLDTSVVDGVIGLAGPYHFTPTSRRFRAIFGPPERYDQMQLGTFIRADQPPMLFLYGQQDFTVGRVNLDTIRPILDRDGACYRINLYPEEGHISIVAAFSWLYRTESPVVRDVKAALAAGIGPYSCP